MSPTNTVAGQPAADLGRDPATWLEVARANGSGTAAGLSGVLTASPRLDGVAAADTALLDVVPTLVTALWPVLWQRWLKDVEHAAQVYELGDWAARVLSPLGPFPALRVGSVPYGVLPAGDPAAWAAGSARPGVGGGDHVRRRPRAGAVGGRRRGRGHGGRRERGAPARHHRPRADQPRARLAPVRAAGGARHLHGDRQRDTRRPRWSPRGRRWPSRRWTSSRLRSAATRRSGASSPACAAGAACASCSSATSREPAESLAFGARRSARTIRRCSCACCATACC